MSPGTSTKLRLEDRSHIQYGIKVPAKSFSLTTESSPYLFFGILSVVYIVAVVGLSSLKLLWLDELITLHIARVSSVAGIWRVLNAGADPNPPVTHMLVHLCRWAFGEGEFSLRLPAIVGYWIGMCALFSYLKRRVPVIWALGATLLSMTMAAFDYSYESRSYALMYGFAMLAFFCWSRSVDSEVPKRQQRIALVGTVLALALGVSTNYFAVLAFLPIAAGELVRIIQWRVSKSRANNHIEHSVALPMPARGATIQIWLALALGALPLLAFRHMIEHSISQFGPYAWNKVSMQQVFDSYTEMIEIVLYPLLLLLFIGTTAWALARLCSSNRAMLWPGWVEWLIRRMRTNGILPLHEAVGVFFLMAYPILGFTVAKIHGGMLSPRFVIPVCFGFAISGTITAFRLFGDTPRAGTVFVCITLMWFLTRESVVGYWYAEQKQCFYKILTHLQEAELVDQPSAPIAVPDPLLALTFQHYAPRDIAVREVFPIDFPSIRRLRGDDSPEENLWAGRGTVYTLPIITIAKFEKNAGDYLIIASDDNWMVTDLRDHRYPVERLNINTRAGAIGGFTPLCHGVPVFFHASGDLSTRYIEASDNLPESFNARENLPSLGVNSEAKEGWDRQ